MDGVHDLGGMHGFGPVEREENEPPFHAALGGGGRRHRCGPTRGAGLYNIDEFRHGIERMDPAHYLGSSYFEHWLDGIARVLVEKGVVDAEELERAHGVLPASGPMRPPRRAARGRRRRGGRRSPAGSQTSFRDARRPRRASPSAPP